MTTSSYFSFTPQAFRTPTPCGGFSIRDGINLDDPFIDEPGEPTKSGEEVAGLFDPKGPHPFPSCHASCRLDRTVTLRGIEEMTWLGMVRNSSSVR